MAEKTNIKKCKQLVSNLKKKVYFKSALAAYNKKYSQIVQKLVADGEQQESASTLTIARHNERSSTTN